MGSIDTYNQFSTEYDKWFDEHSNLYQSELLAIQSLLPTDGNGIEIGVGTGRFAHPLGIPFGVEPSKAMADIARQRGIEVTEALAENLPFEESTFGFALMVTVDCFLSDIPKAFSEVHRILKPNGSILIGMIDKDSPLGQMYERNKADSVFYKEATFHSVAEISEMLQSAGFDNLQYQQTLTYPTNTETEPPKSGYGKGSFVVIKASKSNH